MDRSSRQRIWKVEKLLSKAEELVSIARQKREKSRAETLACLMPIMRGDARPHATAVAAIVISGEPKVDEPLVRAWARTLAHHRMDLQDSTLDKRATLRLSKERCILLLLRILIMGHLGGILLLGTRRRQRDFRKYSELHQFGCYSLP